MRLVFVLEDLCEDLSLHVNIGNNVDSGVANISHGHCKGGEPLSSVMSHVTCCDVPTEEHMYVNVVTNATLQIVYKKWTDLVVAVSWFEPASHTVAVKISFRDRAI